MDKVTGQFPQTTTFLTRMRRAKAVSNRGPSAAYQPNALPLGQTGSLNLGSDDDELMLNVLRCHETY